MTKKNSKQKCFFFVITKIYYYYHYYFYFILNEKRNFLRHIYKYRLFIPQLIQELEFKSLQGVRHLIFSRKFFNVSRVSNIRWYNVPHFRSKIS